MTMASMERPRRLLIISISLNLVAMSMSAPPGETLRRQARSKSLASQSDDSVLLEVGDPQELAWQAWRKVGHGGGNMGSELDSASVMRKITPKSIFIAPSLEALPDCAEGYQADPMNRCVKNVNINHEAHLDFLVQRLNAMYGNLGNNAEPVQDSLSTGPLHLDLLNIPVEELEDEDDGKDPDDESLTSIPSSQEEGTTTKKDVNPPAVGSADDDDDVNEDEESEKQFFDGPQSTKDGRENDESNSNSFEGVIPVVDFVDDANSSYPEVIDYKVESDDKLHNPAMSLDVKKLQLDGDDKREHSKDKRPSTDSSLAPTVVLLLTPTKQPATNDDLIVAHNTTTDELGVRRNNDEKVSEAEEILGVDLPQQLISSTAVQYVFNASTTDDSVSSTSQYPPSTTEGLVYAETDEPESFDTELPGEDEDLDSVDESTESEDELFVHSEAGMMVTMPPRIPESSTIDNEETTASKISSEISITNDFIRETILLGLSLKDSNGTVNSSQPEDKLSTILADEKLLTVTPEMAPDQESTTLPDDVSSATVRPDEETTEDAEGQREFTTSTEVIPKHQDFPETTSVYEVFSTDQRELNPVIKIDESAIDESVKEDVPRTENTPTMLPLTSSEDPEESESSEMMTASSSNNAEALLHQNKFERIQFALPGANSRKQMGLLSVLPDTADKYMTSTISENPEVVTEIKKFDDPVNLRRPEVNNFFPDQRRGPSTKDIVRFPTSDKNRLQVGHVKFPRDEANSIHTSNDIKNSLHHRTYNLPGYRNPAKSPSTSHKQISWPSGRTDRQGSVRSRSGANDKPKDRSPIWFWNRMPLRKDPTLPRLQHPAESLGSNEKAERRVENARRINYYQKISSNDAPRSFARSSALEG